MRQSISTVCMHTRRHTKAELVNKAVPVISNHTGTSEDSVATTPTMCATGSLSITENVKGDSSKSRGAASAGTSGFGIHSMCKRQVEDFWGRPLSTALIWERQRTGDCVTQCYATFLTFPSLTDLLPESFHRCLNMVCHRKKKNTQQKHVDTIKHSILNTVCAWAELSDPQNRLRFNCRSISEQSAWEQNLVFGMTKHLLCRDLLWFHLLSELQWL